LTEVSSVVRRIEKGGPDEYRKLLVDALQYQDSSRSGIISGALLKLVKSEPDQEIQDAAFTVLRSLDNHAESALEAVSTCIELIDSEVDPSVRVRAILAIRDLGPDAGSEAVPALIRALNNTDASTDVRLAACSVLGSLGIEAREAIPSLCRAQEKEDLVRREAARALLQIDPGGQFLAPQLDGFSRPALINALKRIGKTASELRRMLQGEHTAPGMGGHHKVPGGTMQEPGALVNTGVPEQPSSCGILENRTGGAQNLPDPDCMEFRTQDDIGKYVGVEGRTIRNWFKIGKLPKMKQGGLYLISRSTLDALKR
jgi:excisionase family DNA binding protein